MKKARRFALASVIFVISLCGCDEIHFMMEEETVYAQKEIISEEISTALWETTTEADEQINQRRSSELLQDPKGLNNRIFYVYHLSPRASDSENDGFMSWEFVSGEDKEHNEWIETQTFNSVFRYGNWCIRTGYYNESGQWGVTIFRYNGLYSEYVGCGQSMGQTISYENGDYWLVAPDAFCVPNDHSAEITSFDENKQTVTLTFTSPEGKETEVYFNYVQHCRSDEDGTPLLNENGNTFLYQFD